MGGRGAESVSFDDESFGDFSDGRYHVRDLTLVDHGLLEYIL